MYHGTHVSKKYYMEVPVVVRLILMHTTLWTSNKTRHEENPLADFKGQEVVSYHLNRESSIEQDENILSFVLYRFTLEGERSNDLFHCT